MAPHSSTLAWKIPWTEEPGRLWSMGSRRVRHAEWLPFTFHFHALEKEMLTHFSVLAWRIPGTGEPVGLPSMGLQSWTRLKRLSSSSSRKISMRQTHVGAWKRRKKSGHMMNFWKTFQGKTVKWYMDMKKCLKRLERIKQTKRNDWNYMEEY